MTAKVSRIQLVEIEKAIEKAKSARITTFHYM